MPTPSAVFALVFEMYSIACSKTEHLSERVEH